ncbi:phosphotransferase enzyme family protein [Polyplosphaeria fusca]|uniref:Altered inheritance of mitochondria protein 9, mitochondrial n=1 Tax=Polyplosphaeria fusca TaxID=682080 RepID=A0A9P4QXF8_9PLEO|nr:phosphotransferase enzyme family protein [Polyplosphaeria fusca]
MPKQSIMLLIQSDLKYSDDLFNYTRGRFVCDEGYEISQRRVRFNVNELARCAAETIGAKLCVNIKKYPDGMYNKSMLLTMDNGSQVVAKVPNPNAGIPHFTTANEVATMDFVRFISGVIASRYLTDILQSRNVLGTPVPRVFAWSSKVQENPVGAEYIIMEKIAEIELERVWPSMNIKDRLALFKTIAGFQKAWTSVSFKKFGGLYCAKDLEESASNEPLYVDANGIDITDERFVIGLSTGRESIDNGRATIDFDRGPWMPQRNWHGDLHVANIFVNPSEPTEVVGLIDWQSTEISPLYFHARQPQILDYDSPPVSGLERPQLPKDVEKLEASAKQHAETLYLQQSLCSLYNTLTHRRNPRLYAALGFQQTTSFLLLLLPRDLLIDGEVSYLLQVAELEATWNSLPEAKGSTYPFSFSPKEVEEIEAEVEGMFRGMEAMRLIGENMGELFPEQGIVTPDQYEETLGALAQMKEQVIEKFASTEEERKIWQRVWPFGN